MFRVRSIARQCLLIALAWPLAACSSGSATSPDSAAGAGASGVHVGCAAASADNYEPGMTKLGDAARFSFALVSSTPAPPALNDNAFVVQVLRADGSPVTGQLSVALEMPEHGHPSPMAPTISFDPGSQTFTLDPMRLFMVGLWRFTFSFAADASTPTAGDAGSAGDTGIPGDSAVFKFCVD